MANLPAEAQAEARKAALEVLLRNIVLPRDEEMDPQLAQVLEGLFLVARDQKAMARLKGELEQILQNYLQVRNNAYQQLKPGSAPISARCSAPSRPRRVRRLIWRWSIYPSSRRNGAASTAI